MQFVFKVKVVRPRNIKEGRKTEVAIQKSSCLLLLSRDCIEKQLFTSERTFVVEIVVRPQSFSSLKMYQELQYFEKKKKSSDNLQSVLLNLVFKYFG